MAGRGRSPARRRLLQGALSTAAASAFAFWALPAIAQNPESASAGTSATVTQTGIVVVSRERILRESVAARRLREAEESMTAKLQSQIDETKAGFAAEEEELARLRGNLAEEEFNARVSDFDRRVRFTRRNAQERAAALQKTFQDARAAIVAALPALMERLRVEAGADVVLNADQVLALDPSSDLTDRAIALFDAEGPSAEPPEIDLSAPLSPPPGEGAATRGLRGMSAPAGPKQPSP